MKYSFWEKVGGSLLLTAWLIYLGNMAGNALVHPKEAMHKPEPAAHAEAEAAPAEAAQPAAEIDVMALIAAADPAAGMKVFNKCKSCHSNEEGGKHKVGPNLWEIVGRSRGGADGFAYSDAMSGAGGNWGYDELNAFLTSPKEAVPGNKMSFKGVSNPEQRAALIAFLRTLSGNPLPLP